MTIYQPSTDTLWETWKMSQSLLPPVSESATTATGGSLPAGTYDYGVTALTPTGETTLSPVRAYSVPAGGKVTLKWTGPVGATGYKIYRGPDASHLQLVATLAHQTTQPSDPGCTWTDTGTGAPSSVPPPTANTATTPGQWHASWGGRIQHVSLDPGYYRNIPDGAGGYSEQAGWGVTASSLPVVGGLITLSDLAAGQINHALAIMVPQAAKGIFSFPAQRTDGVSAGSQRDPRGSSFPAAGQPQSGGDQRAADHPDDRAGRTELRADRRRPDRRLGRVPGGGPDAADAPGPGQSLSQVLHQRPAAPTMTPNQLLASFPWADLELVAPSQ